jgi:hypothetical protein
MTGLSINKRFQNIGSGRTRVDFRRRDSIHSHTIIQGRVRSLFSEEKFCIKKIFHLKVEISHQSKQEKEKRTLRKKLCNVVDVKSHTC